MWENGEPLLSADFWQLRVVELEEYNCNEINNWREITLKKA